MPMSRIRYKTAWNKDQTARLAEKTVGYDFSGNNTACQPKHELEGGVGETIAALLDEGLDCDHIFL